ncbi:Oidioi.mRNA.OKI2018_I69.PAR.g8823.t1.cds [Oikopleura dioica]|uniref:Oidioi.mRNA.OKI2018_I69.PAR.g8823.t1.cds n=1 Tax=Oikopleura dioica TaxID=34765 RepID=A0ABN7RM92_OIKDI|nr:Oidioi.mRNA.OKI2018_I69.PAR.g8823.t1.cds [Oikopleura dioica]
MIIENKRRLAMTCDSPGVPPFIHERAAYGIPPAKRTVYTGNAKFLRSLFSRQTALSRRLLWGFILLAGTSYSVFTISFNAVKFGQNPTSIVTETVMHHHLNMPNVYVCPNSQHSKWRIERAYPMHKNLHKYISTFYGNGREDHGPLNLSRFDDIPLDEFLSITAPDLMPLRCKFNMRDCPPPTNRLTRYGICLYYSFENSTVSIPGPQSSLILYVAYNHSDTTTGVLQFIDGLTLFYSQYSDHQHDVMLMSQSTTVLANRLTQVALYPQEYTYLPPHCGSKKLDFFQQYTTEECHVECSYKAVMDKCKCWPPYFPIYKKEYPMCTFTEHSSYSTCGNCPKPCHDLVYNRNVEYGKFHEPIQRALKKYHEHNHSTAEIGAFQIFFPSLDVTLHREREDYSTTQFVSELGGAAGLFLGVSLISVIKILDHLFTLAAKHYEEMVQEYSYAVRRVRENICQTDLQSVILPWVRETKKKKKPEVRRKGSLSRNSLPSRRRKFAFRANEIAVFEPRGVSKHRNCYALGNRLKYGLEGDEPRKSVDQQVAEADLDDEENRRSCQGYCRKDRRESVAPLLERTL